MEGQSLAQKSQLWGVREGSGVIPKVSPAGPEPEPGA